MSNPGHDIFNMQADDVLAPKRQAEIAQVMAVLKRFQPTKIAVERDPGDNRLSKDYADYLAGKHELTRNEIEQLGFRLAKELGHMVKAQDAYLASHTVLETLLYMNADDKVAQDVGYYYRQAHLGEAWDWAGADLVADWFR